MSFRDTEPPSLIPLLTWYRGGGVLMRSADITRDILYTCGDKKPRYPMPVVFDEKLYSHRQHFWYVSNFGRPKSFRDMG